MKSFLQRYKELIDYLIFGVLTTVVNYGVFALLKVFWGDDYILIANLVTFIIATLFAYVTNKLYVFKSKTTSFSACLKELIAFFGARISSFFLEELGLFLCADVFDLGRYSLLGLDGIMLSKIALSFFAVIINYFFSKFWIFKKKGGEPS